MPPKTNSIRTLIRSLMPSLPADTQKWEHILDWPPDVFGLAAYLLHKTGVYRYAVCNHWWAKGRQRYQDEIMDVGKSWRHAVAHGKQIPKRVRELWQEVVDVSDYELVAIDDGNHDDLIRALLLLVGISDSACHDFGVPFKRGPKALSDADAALLERVEGLLSDPVVRGDASTLALRIDSQLLCVLPKIRTPQTGLTMRSFSHHLAFWPRDELCPKWVITDAPQTQWESDRFNLLLVPWPYQISNTQFRKAKDENRCGPHYMDDRFGFFDYVPCAMTDWLEKEFPQLLKAAESRTGGEGVHGVIFPELAFATKQELLRAYEIMQDECPNAFLLAGVSDSDDDTKQASNVAYFVTPFLGAPGQAVIYRQAKHHRWQLDRGQIKRYKLASRLDAGKLWWESSAVHSRDLHFLALKKWLALSFLICEDLARQEPASRLVRAVGPNLLIALLLDGQQFNGRWPGRYAGVFAEDPGTSVLTLTSLGMVMLGKSSDDPVPAAECQVCNIALWRDRFGDAVEIAMKPDDHGILLSLSQKSSREFSADGRVADASDLVIVNPKSDVICIRLPSD